MHAARPEWEPDMHVEWEPAAEPAVEPVALVALFQLVLHHWIAAASWKVSQHPTAWSKIKYSDTFVSFICFLSFGLLSGIIIILISFLD